MLEEETPNNIIFLDWAAETSYLEHSYEKRKSSLSSVVRFLYCIANFSRAARCLALILMSRGFFYLLIPSVKTSKTARFMLIIKAKVRL